MGKTNKYEIAIKEIEKELKRKIYNKQYVAEQINLITEHTCRLFYMSHKFKGTTVGEYSESEANHLTELLFSVLFEHPDYAELKSKYG